MSVQSLTKCLAEMAEDMDALRASLDEAQQQNVTLQLRVQQVCCLGAVLVHLIWCWTLRALLRAIDGVLHSGATP